MVGSEQEETRAVLVLQNDVGNCHSSTTIVSVMTTQHKSSIPTHVQVNVKGRMSTVLLEQARTISRLQLLNYVGHLADEDVSCVERALKVSLNLEAS